MMQPKAAGSPERRLVVAVDDQPEILSLIAAILESAHYNVLCVGSGAACIDLLFKVTPRLVLLDIEMPEMNGFQTCRRVRANPAHRLVPVVFLTARKAFEDVTEGLSSGGNDFIIKPPRRSLLLERVGHWTTKQLGA